MPAQKSTGVATKKRAVLAPAPSKAVLDEPATVPDVNPSSSSTDGTAVPDVPDAADTKPASDAADTKPVVNNPVTSFVNRLNAYVERVTVLHKDMKEMVTEGRGLEKEYASIVKLMSKKTKFAKSNEDRPLSGFAMPSLLSDELYEFLDLEKGTKVPRKDITRMINTYIKNNELRDETDKRTIRPNAALHKIFRSTDADDISYFNLQKFIKHHFLKESDIKARAIAAA